MIVGTAGHIDHGKTALVRALTGVDTDRLPEEKKRGITLELGYAHLPVEGGEPVAFVDVPGHEKLVRTMVAGATGMDFVLLLVAADDGVMPQTEEHAAIVSLLGIRRGAALVTKIDKADAPLRQQREQEARALLTRHGLATFPVLPVSAQQGEGLAALRQLLLAEARTVSRPGHSAQGFCMPLDRAFSLDGVGTVVAGTVAGGQVRPGDALCFAEDPAHSWRVRSVQSHGRSVAQAAAGQRCALGLAGLERSQAERGRTVCDPGIAHASLRADAWLQLASGEPRPLRSGTQVHLHLGTVDTIASVALLDRDALAPGDAAFAQLVLREPLALWWGDRFVLRDASAARTIGGGQVLDAAAPARYRRTPERMAFLAAQRAGDPRQRLQGALAAAPYGLDARAWLRVGGWKEWPLDPATLADTVVARDGHWLIARRHLAVASTELGKVLADFHAKHPEDIGPDVRRARRLAVPRMPEALWEAFLAQLVADGTVQGRRGFLFLPDHGAQLREAERIVAQRALPLLQQGAFDPPWVRDIAGTARLPEAQVRSVLARLAKTGEVYQVVKDLYYHPAAVRQLAALARALERKEGRVLAASFRDATGLGRKRAIQVLEFFDRIGFLRRVGDEHLLRPGTPLFAEGAAP